VDTLEKCKKRPIYGRYPPVESARKIAAPRAERQLPVRHPPASIAGVFDHGRVPRMRLDLAGIGRENLKS
jgi:hypothetical protein